MEEKKTDTKKKLRSAALKAAGTVTAAGMLFNAAVEPEDLLSSPRQNEQAAGAAHIQSGSAPLYTVKGAPLKKSPTKAELFREKVIPLPAPVKGLILLPLWTLGAIANYALSLLLSLFSAVFGGSLLTFLFQFALLFGLFALALKLLFPHKKLRELLTRKNLLWMAICALILTSADMILKTWYAPYAKIRGLILLALALLLLSLLAWRILGKREEPDAGPQTATYEIV
jgi:hypothetical protein